MADRDLRKAELERKKAKLAEMRKEKQRKEVNLLKTFKLFVGYSEKIQRVFYTQIFTQLL